MSDLFPEETTEVETFLPTDDEPPSAEDALAALERSLDDDPDLDDFIVAEDAPQPVGKSWAFDFVTGRFVKGGGRGPLATHHYTTLRTWIEKCLRTDRGAHPIHPPDYGMERPFDMIGQHVDDVLGGDLEGRVTEALLFHPRITDVRDFAADYDPNDEHAFLSFTAVLDDDTELPVEVVL